MKLSGIFEVHTNGWSNKQDTLSCFIASSQIFRCPSLPAWVNGRKALLSIFFAARETEPLASNVHERATKKCGTIAKIQRKGIRYALAQTTCIVLNQVSRTFRNGGYPCTHESLLFSISQAR